MKKVFFIALIASMAISCNNEKDNPKPKEELFQSDSIAMGDGAANDVYYSLASGEVSTSENSNWDLAFSTSAMDIGIHINEAAGVSLYTYLGGVAADWATIDTTGNIGQALYNPNISWNVGAFESLAQSHPNYGWGTYNPTSHDVVGDSIYLLKLADDSYKKILIEKKGAMDYNYQFKYANLDGSEEVSETITLTDYASKNMVYYSLATQGVIDREPAASDWELVFTKYVKLIPISATDFMPYPVTGVLTNGGVEVAELMNVNRETIDVSTLAFSDTISVIGDDWKSFDMNTFSYAIDTAKTYCIKGNDDKVYAIYFEGYTGSSTAAKVNFKVAEIK